MTPDGRTIAALLTPLAPGGIAVIGLAGPGADAILGRILRRPGSDRPPDIADRTPRFARLVDRGEVLDDVVVVRARRGKVVTAELHTHGGVRIAQRALMLLERCGASIVDAEVFVARFTPAGTIEQQVDHALLRVSSRRLTCWLLAQRSILPAYVDRLALLDPGEAAAFQHRSRIAVRLIQGLRVAVVGPPNAGKSTLANRLIGSDRVITSDQAGTTRDWVSETALMQGWPVTLTDTAGVREPACDIEAEAIRRGRQQAGRADLVVVVLDATVPPERQRAEWESLCDALRADQPRVTALNKCDAPMADCGLRVADSPIGSFEQRLCISALTGAGVGALESRIASALGLDRLDDDHPTGFLPCHLAR